MVSNAAASLEKTGACTAKFYKTCWNAEKSKYLSIGRAGRKPDSH